MKKSMAIITCAIIVAFLSSFSMSQAAVNKPATKAELADILVKVLNITLPSGSDNLSKEALFEVEANMLAERKITIFIDSKPSDPVTRGDLASIVYIALTGDNAVNLQEMVNHMAGLGYISPGKPGDIMNMDAIVNTLNIPELAPVFALAYSSPGSITRGGMQAPQRANPTPEKAASPV